MPDLLAPERATQTPSAAPTPRRDPRSAGRLLLAEFNELCPSLLERFMAEGRLPNFRRLYQSSEVFTTDAGEPADRLEPWIQWPTVHSGLPFAEHGVFHLGDGRRMRAKCVAEVLSDAGLPVGVCGSMNTNYGTLNGYVLPDPWGKDATACPADLAPFARTLARLVQEASRSSVNKRDLLSFGWFLLRNGLSFRSVLSAAGQLLSERREPGLTWRRACVLDSFQYDLFRHLNRKHAVRFATFFANSTAHFQHYYWRHMDPAGFSAPPPAGDAPSLRDAVRTGYERMDLLVGRLMRDYPDAVIVLCTALSQQPWDATKCTWRPTKFADLFAFAGVDLPEAAAKPVMAEQFHVACGSEEAARRVEGLLRDLRMNGEPLMAVKREGDSVFTGCRVEAAEPGDGPVVRAATGATKAFGSLFYRIHTMRSGRHHPDGVLWVRTGTHRVTRDRVPLTAVAPTVLAHFGVEPPAGMRTPALRLAAASASRQLPCGR